MGFLGDGINDAAALRESDIGISVDSAVDIAKESADIILLEKDLMVLENGVLEGRKTFGNIVKYVKMTASSNFGNMFSVLAASAFLPFLPMLPIHLLIQNLLYDISQTTIPFDRMDREYLAKPRVWDSGDLSRFMIWIGPISSIFDIATYMVMWWVFKCQAGHGIPFPVGLVCRGFALADTHRSHDPHPQGSVHPEFCLMACDADDLLHHGNRPLYSVHHIRQFDRPDSSSMDLLSMAHRHSAVLLRIDAMAQNPLYQGFQTLVVM